MSLNAMVVGRNTALDRAIRDALGCFLDVKDVAVAQSGRECLAIANLEHFDVIVVDVDLPDMKCGTLLKTLLAAQSSLKLIVTMDASDTTSQAAAFLNRHNNVQVVARPTPKSSVRFIEALRSTMGGGKVPARKPVAGAKPNAKRDDARPQPRPSRPAVSRPKGNSDFWVTAIAISTGGPAALSKMVPMLPGDYPHPILVVQHMPPIFTSSLARDLNANTALNVVEAKEGDILQAGTVYIAPGGKHMEVVNSTNLHIRLTNAPPENSCRPSADVMFRSLVGIKPDEAVLGVVMTGMGMDGCSGIRILKGGNCHCITQNESSCAVYGMPRAVDDAGLSDESVDLMRIAERLTALAKGRARARV